MISLLVQVLLDGVLRVWVLMMKQTGILILYSNWLWGKSLPQGAILFLKTVRSL